MPEPTGERMMPEHQSGELVHAEHVARYRMAVQYVSGKRVLDAACGEGYGSQMLLGAGAKTVVGIDVDAATVAEAGQKYGAEFVVGDAAELPFEEDAFDLIVSFETIEHLEDPARMLDEFSRVLAPGGAVIVSTPNSLEYKVENEFHVKEFTPGEFEQLLTPRFGKPRFVYQQTWLFSALLEEASFASTDASAPLDLDVYKAAGRNPGQELYLIALCGDLDVPRELGYVADVFEANKLIEWIGRAEQAEVMLHSYVERSKNAEELLKEWLERCKNAEKLLLDRQDRCDEAERTIERLLRKNELLEKRGLNKLAPIYREIKRRRAGS